MNIDQKAEKLALVLTKETSLNKLEWKQVNRVPAYFSEGTNDIYPMFFKTKYKEQNIGVFEKRYKHFIDEDTFIWSTSFGLCMLDNFNDVSWAIDSSSLAVANLFEVASEQASGISDVLDDLLES